MNDIAKYMTINKNVKILQYLYFKSGYCENEIDQSTKLIITRYFILSQICI